MFRVGMNKGWRYCSDS